MASNGGSELDTRWMLLLAHIQEHDDALAICHELLERVIELEKLGAGEDYRSSVAPPGLFPRPEDLPPRPKPRPKPERPRPER